MAQLFSNAARSPLMASILAGDTSLTVDAALADLFPVADTGSDPVPTAGKDFFKIVLENAAHEKEIVYVRTRALGDPIFSNVIRGQEGTTARAYTAGDVVGLRLTADDYEEALANVGVKIAAATSKATPVDADTLALSDSAASNVLKKLTWANLKAALKAFFDTIYTTGGTSTAYTLTPAPAIAAYAAGQSFFVNFNAASGASPTLTISGVTTPPNLVKQLADGSYANIAANDIPVNHRSRVTLLSAAQAWVETMPSTSVRAWALFDGTLGGTNAPTAGSKVTSITRDSGGGNYTVNLAVTMASANYAVVATASASTGSAGRIVGVDARTTTSFRILTENTSGVVSDSGIVSFMVIGA